MSSEPVVDVFTVVLCYRLMDMAQMCESLAKNCDSKDKKKTARRLRRASVGFNDILKELENDARQKRMFF